MSPVTHVDPPGGFTAADSGEHDRVTILDWRSNHKHPVFPVFQLLAGSWAVPAALTEMRGGTILVFRPKYSFQYCDQVRLFTNVKAPGGKGFYQLQYSSNGGTTWGSLDGVGGPRLPLSRYGLIDSGWLTIGATLRAFCAAGADVLLRMTGDGGDGTVVTTFGMTGVMVR
jgi:hypothetical protein